MTFNPQNIWSGAIHMESQISEIGSDPQFTQLPQAVRCYLVEYQQPMHSWKFFWSIPEKYGTNGVFVTELMKEDPPKNGERYWNDAGAERMEYNTTLTLTSTPIEDGQGFIYRQHFDNWTGAFMGSLAITDRSSIPTSWVNYFDENCPAVNHP